MVETPNLTYVLNLAGTDFDFERKFIAILKYEFPLDYSTYSNHIRNGEPRAASEIVHKIKYKLSVLGMERAFQFAEYHQEKLRTGDTRMDPDFQMILETVDNYLKKL